MDALEAAIEFQQAMADVDRHQAEETSIAFRIGLHLGGLIVEGDDLYGDGVNVAARLEARAPAGGIEISGDMHNAVAGRLNAAFDDLGNLALENIERPVQAFGIKWNPDDWKVSAPSTVTPAIAAAPPADAALSLPDKPSIAVQEEVTRAIVAAIAPQVEAVEHSKVIRRKPGSLSAYEIALRAYTRAWDGRDKADRTISSSRFGRQRKRWRSTRPACWPCMRSSWPTRMP